jgi:RNA polymerase sigma-B factor
MAALADGDPQRALLREQLIERCLPVAEHISRRFHGRGEPVDDLLQVARLGLIQAINRFDITYGSHFLSFAVPTIVGEIRRYFRDTGWAVHVPRRLQQLHSVLEQTASDLAQRLGRAPTLNELAQELDLDPDEITQGLLARHAYTVESFDRTLAGAGEDDPVLVDRLGEEDPALEYIDNHHTLIPLLHALPDRDRTVLMLRFFGDMTQTQIAERIGVSQMHVSRILNKTLAQLREDFG